MNKLELQENLKKYTCIENCIIRNVISKFSGKWAILVLCVLYESGTIRFNLINRALPDISPKVLTQTLKTLEEIGLVSRTVYSEIPPRVEYSLTKKGDSLMPNILNLIDWAIQNS